MGGEAVPAGEVAEGARPWWEKRLVLILVVLATMVPLLYPPIAPLVDLPGHIGRYRVELDLAHSLWLQRYYDYHWAPLGSLGVDILVLGLAPLVGLEPAVKLIVLAIPPLTAAAFLWVAREVHGRVPPTAFFALPFITGFPFLFGFVNFALAAGLAFLALGLWLRLGRLGRQRLRGWLFVPISFALFFCHTTGWGMLGLMAFAAEAVRLRDDGRSWFGAVRGSALSVSVMAPPLLVMLLWPAGQARGAIGGGWFDWDAKWVGLLGTLRDRWGPFDVAAIEVAGLVLLFALLSPKLALARSLAFCALMFALCFVLLPQFLFDSAYADVRLLPFAFAAGLLAVRLRAPADLRLGQWLAVLGLAFFAVRLAGTTVSLAIAADEQRAKLRMLDVVPQGARVASFFVLPYAEPWGLQRDSHLGGMVIARREGFSNDQWITPGHNLLELRYREAGSFGANPSEIVRPNGTHDGVYRTIDEALAKVPRNNFDYIWLLNDAQFDPRLAAGLQPVARSRGAVLYRVQPHEGRINSVQPIPASHGQLSARR